jgi:hypothetical protein
MNSRHIINEMCIVVDSYALNYLHFLDDTLGDKGILLYEGPVATRVIFN